MRQQAGLLEHPDGHGPHVGERVVVPVGVEPVAELAAKRSMLGAVGEIHRRLLPKARIPVAAIALNNRHHGLRRDEAGQVVNVAVGVVAGDAAA